MSDIEDNEQQKSGWWGTTLGKLKSALARTKDAVVDQIVDRPAAQEGTLTDSVQEQALAALAGSQSTRQPANQLASPGAGILPAAEAGGTPAPQVNQLPAVQAPVISTPPPPPPKPTRPIDDDYLEDLEEKLIRADLGLATAQTMVGDLRKQARSKGWNSGDVEKFLKQEFTTIIKAAPDPALKYQPGKLNIYLVVGVNGTGKTTSIGKLCWRFKQQGRKVLMAAADTFRAAAETQLEIWSTRAGVDIVRLPDGSDPGAVVYQAIQKAKSESYDCLVIDTAGRLHNKTNLMAELKKVRSVVEKNAGDNVLESLLVLDASTGQNGLQQARVFTEVCPLTGVILTKLDGTAKGGVVFSIARDLKIPVKLIGLGEQIDDLRDFEPEMFVEALF